MQICYFVLLPSDSDIQSGHFEPLGASLALKEGKWSKQLIDCIL
jgi:hypothetical protein